MGDRVAAELEALASRSGASTLKLALRRGEKAACCLPAAEGPPAARSAWDEGGAEARETEMQYRISLLLTPGPGILCRLRTAA